MKRAWTAFLPILLTLLLSNGCVNEQLGGNDIGPSQTSSYFPITIGNSWVYQSYSNVDGEWNQLLVTHRRITEGEMYENEYGYISVDSIGVGSDTPAERYIMRRNQGSFHRVTTLHTQPVTDNEWGPWYDIYNFDSSAEGARWMEVDDENVVSYWELSSLSETVEVDAGTFTNCRVNTWRSETTGQVAERSHYFASGIGEVLEEVHIWESGSLIVNQRRELVSYSLN